MKGELNMTLEEIREKEKELQIEKLQILLNQKKVKMNNLALEIEKLESKLKFLHSAAK